MDTREFLIDWAVKFVKNKDIVARKIESVDINKDGHDLVVQYKDKTQFFLVMPSLDAKSAVSGMKTGGNIGYAVVTLNNKKNLDDAIKNWNDLIKIQSLTLYFVNPFSSLDKKWIISPYVHHRICDEESLELGLKSIAEAVEPITPEEIERRT